MDKVISILKMIKDEDELIMLRNILNELIKIQSRPNMTLERNINEMIGLIVLSQLGD